MMKLGTKYSCVLVLLGMLLSIQISGSAQDFRPPVDNYYIGAAGGVHNLSIRDVDGVDERIIDFDEKSFAYKVYGGRRFSKHLGLELSIVDYGEPEGSVFNVSGVSDELKVDEWGSTLHGVLYVPTELNKDLTFFAKGGPAWIDQDVDVEATVSGNTVKVSEKGSGLGGSVAVGANISVSSDFTLRVEGETILLDEEADTDRYLGFVGLHYKFD